MGESERLEGDVATLRETVSRVSRQWQEAHTDAQAAQQRAADAAQLVAELARAEDATRRLLEATVASKPEPAHYTGQCATVYSDLGRLIDGLRQ